MLLQGDIAQEVADIVVVGLGGAGLVAAITAQEHGAEVLVVEKQSREHHCSNTKMSGGVFVASHDEERSINYVQSLYRTEGEPAMPELDLLQAWAHYISGNADWVRQRGGHISPLRTAAEHSQFDGHDSLDVFQFAGSGLGMHRFLSSLAEGQKVGVLFGAEARVLLMERDREITGVRVSLGQAGRYVDVRARKAVILTCGGFEFDEYMKLSYLRVYPTHFYGSPANSGDGHRMVMRVGADLWHMNCCSARLVGKFPGFPIAFSMNFPGGSTSKRKEDARGALSSAGYLVVDTYGKRFTSENFKTHTLYYELAAYDSQRCLFPRAPSFWIFDSRRMAAGPLPGLQTGPSGPVQLYRWDKSNETELERGWITKANSPGELAIKLGIPADGLSETITRYNHFCSQGRDADYGRSPGDLVPLDVPPFYGVRLYPGGPNTQGGPRRDHKARVLNVDREPIRRLYAAGELGSIYGMLYPCIGSNLAECIAFGRIAAENACSEKPR